MRNLSFYLTDDIDLVLNALALQEGMHVGHERLKVRPVVSVGNDNSCSDRLC